MAKKNKTLVDDVERRLTPSPQFFWHTSDSTGPTSEAVLGDRNTINNMLRTSGRLRGCSIVEAVALARYLGQPVSRVIEALGYPLYSERVRMAGEAGADGAIVTVAGAVHGPMEGGSELRAVRYTGKACPAILPGSVVYVAHADTMPNALDHDGIDATRLAVITRPIGPRLLGYAIPLTDSAPYFDIASPEGVKVVLRTTVVGWQPAMWIKLPQTAVHALGAPSSASDAPHSAQAAPHSARAPRKRATPRKG